MSASEILSEILILPIEVVLKMVLNKLSNIMITSELAHQNRDTKSFLISEFSIHVFIMIGERILEMIAEDRFIFVFVSCWSMGESSSKSKVKGNWLEADICIIIDLSDSFYNTIIKSLEFESFSIAG